LLLAQPARTRAQRLLLDWDVPSRLNSTSTTHA
jgi:hypothetical protein